MRRLILACFAMLGALFGASIALVPGEAQAQPTCVAVSETLRCSAVGRDNAMWRIAFDGTRWGTWTSHGGVIEGELNCINWLSRHDCFARGPGGVLNQRVMSPAEDVRWDNLGGSASGTPTCFHSINKLDCFIRGTDNALWRRSGRVGHGWTDWNSAGGVLASDPECVRQSNDRFDCMVRNTNGGLSHVACVRGSPCAGWVNLDGTLNSRLSCARESVRATLQPFVCFVRGTDNKLYSKRYDGTWGPWQLVNDRTFEGDPSCVTIGADLACYAQLGGNRLHSIRRTAGTWGSWTEVSTTPMLPAPRCTRAATMSICAGLDTLGRMVVIRIPDEGPAIGETVPGLLIRDYRVYH